MPDTGNPTSVVLKTLTATPPPSPHEQLAVIHDAHLRYGDHNGPALFFSTYISEHEAADQYLSLLVSHAALVAADYADLSDHPGYHTQAVDLLDAYHPRQLSDLNGRPVWVTVNPEKNTIVYARPYVRKEVR